MARWLRIVLLVLVGIGLSACEDGDDSTSAPTLDQRLGKYHSSLRTEADWLWNNMTYTRANALPDATRCTATTFSHEPVVMDEAARTRDITAAKLLDHLTYAESLLQESHAEWEIFCQGELSSVNAVAYMESRLRPAYDSLNVVETTLVRRGAPTSTPYRVPE